MAHMSPSGGRRGWPIVASVAMGLLLGAAPARAAEVTQVATALEENKPVEAFLSIAYEYYARRAAIKREWELDSTVNGVGIFKDLRYKQDRHLIRLRGEIGFLWDMSFHVEAPIVVSDQRSLSLDQKLGSDCVFPQDIPAGSDEKPTCVNESNSSTLRDGIVPYTPDANGAPMLNSPHGFDAQEGGAMFPAGDASLFRGPKRYGLESLNLGLDWALLNQRKDDTKPTWVVSAEFLLSLGAPMRFDRNNPTANHSVTPGVHYVMLGTTVSKRLSVVEPYASYYWIYPMYVRDNSLFKNYEGGQKTWRPQQHAGTTFGFEAIPWENPELQQKISIDLRGFLVAHFEGRGYSEIWEMLAGSPALAAHDPALPGEPTGGAGQALMKPTVYPGVTDIENYFSYGGTFGLNVRAGRYMKFRGYFGVSGAQRHFITFADAGKDLGRNDPTDQTVFVPDPNEVVDQHGAAAEREVNPIHRPIIDYVGRRYVADETAVYALMLQGEVIF